MRILVFTHYFPPEGNAPATRMHALCKQWHAAGNDVTVITCVPNVPNGVVYAGYCNHLYQRDTVDGIRIVRVWTYLAPNKGTLLRIVNYLSYMLAAIVAGVLVGKPDVIVATSPQFFCAWAGVWVSRVRRVPLILEIRDLWPESIVAVGALTNRWLIQLLEWLERRLYATAGHIVTVGEGYRDELRKKGVPAARISLIPNGIDRDVLFPRPPAAAVCERWGLHDQFVCAYVGTIGMASGLDVVLRAAAELAARGRTDIKFLVVGDGAVRAELERDAAHRGLTNVVFTGRQDKESIPTLLASVGVCLVHLKKHPLFATVLPSKIFEAAAMAKPVILGVEGYAAELVQRAGAGICIEPENDAQLVDALIRLADDRGFAETLGRSGHDYFVAHFDRSVLALQYLDLIRAAKRTADGSVRVLGNAPSSP